MLRQWSDHVVARELTARQLLEMVIELRHNGLMQDVEALLRAYLRHRSEREPWMYEMLAVALDYNLADEEAVLRALGYAALLADRPGDQGRPESLLTVADMMAIRNADEITLPSSDGSAPRVITIGELLDKAAERLPHRADPLIKSLDLAERQRDPERMARAAVGLLSLGWPGTDEVWRLEIRDRVVKMAESLREAGRTVAAEELLDRLEAAEARDLVARLTWDGFGDLDLTVEEPLGGKATFETPRTVFGGALVVNGRGNDPEEVYVCPRGFSGAYTFHVETVIMDPEEPVRNATLEVITHEGTERERTRTLAIDPKNPEPVTVTLEDGRRTEVLPYIIPKVMIQVEAPRRPPASEADAPAERRP